jgi:hypothetical protein
MFEKPRVPKPASLKVHVSLGPLRPELAEIKCGLSARAAVMKEEDSARPSAGIAIAYVRLTFEFGIFSKTLSKRFIKNYCPSVVSKVI